MTKQQYIFVLIECLLLCSCSFDIKEATNIKSACAVQLPSQFSQNSEALPKSTSNSDFSSLGYLRTRTQLIRIESNQHFSVFNLNGNPIALSINQRDFQEQFPELYHSFKKAIAGNSEEELLPDTSIHNVDRIIPFGLLNNN